MFLKVQFASLVQNEHGFISLVIATHLIGNAEWKKKRLMYAVDSNNVTVLPRYFYELVLV